MLSYSIIRYFFVAFPVYLHIFPVRWNAPIANGYFCLNKSASRCCFTHESHATMRQICISCRLLSITFLVVALPCLIKWSIPKLFTPRMPNPKSGRSDGALSLMHFYSLFSPFLEPVCPLMWWVFILSSEKIITFISGHRHVSARHVHSSDHVLSQSEVTSICDRANANMDNKVDGYKCEMWSLCDMLFSSKNVELFVLLMYFSW